MVLLPVLEPSKRTWKRNLEILSSGFERIPQITKKLTEAEMGCRKLIEKWKKMMT
jgi:hypothetical protein